MNPTTFDIKIMRELADGPMTKRELERYCPEIGNIGRNLDRLHNACYLIREVPPSHNEGTAFALAPKAIRFLEKHDAGEYVGEIVPSRDRGFEGTYCGEKPSPIRPGAMRAFDIPSREGDRIVERKRPISIGCAPEPFYRALP